MSDNGVRKLRGRKMAMIFQDPMSSLHPFYRIGAQLGEAMRVHRKISKAAARAEAIEMLDRVGIPAPKRRVDDYPHQLSGGMRQRVMIAMALINGPALLIADEPTTALDVTVQAQILDLIGQLQTEFNTAVILITHDLGIVADVADEVAVMYAGRVVEQAPDGPALREPGDAVHARPAQPRSRAWTASGRTGSTRSAATRRRRSATRRAASSIRAATTPTASRATRAPPSAPSSCRAGRTTSSAATSRPRSGARSRPSSCARRLGRARRSPRPGAARPSRASAPATAAAGQANGAPA